MTQLQGSFDIVNQSEIVALRARVDALERRSGLMSPSFLTRAFSAWGYVLVAQLLLAMFVGGAFFVLSFCLAILSVSTN